jgi:hypothetical protein
MPRRSPIYARAAAHLPVLASSRRARPSESLRGHAVSLLAGVLSSDSFRLATRLLIAWNAGTWLYFIASGITIAR